MRCLAVARDVTGGQLGHRDAPDDERQESGNLRGTGEREISDAVARTDRDVTLRDQTSRNVRHRGDHAPPTNPRFRPGRGAAEAIVISENPGSLRPMSVPTRWRFEKARYGYLA